MRIFYKSIKDYFCTNFLLMSLSPVLVSFIAFYLIFYFLIQNYIYNYFTENDFNFFLGSYIFWIIHNIIFLSSTIIGLTFSWYLCIIASLVIVSFMTPIIVNSLNKKHYNYIKSSSVSFFFVFSKMFKVFIKTIILLIFIFILYFVPILNLFIHIISFFIFFYLYYNFLILDVASCVLNKEDFKNYNFKNKKLIFVVFIFYIISLIPFLGALLQVFFVIYLSHYLYLNTLKLSSMID